MTYMLSSSSSADSALNAGGGTGLRLPPPGSGGKPGAGSL